MSATTYYSPSGNPEVWAEKPDGYFTVDEWQTAHPAPAPEQPSIEDMFLCLRSLRDMRLTGTDKYLLSDYPFSVAKLAEIKAYRAELRDLPSQPGAPWDGGGEQTPWPELPKT